MVIFEISCPSLGRMIPNNNLPHRPPSAVDGAHLSTSTIAMGQPFPRPIGTWCALEAKWTEVYKFLARSNTVTIVGYGGSNIPPL